MGSRMKRFTGLLKRTTSQGSAGYGNDADLNNAPQDSPQANIARSIRLFCESGSPGNAGEEVLHLPVIVEAAESSPQAAAIGARQVRDFCGKSWANKPHCQYNAIMLIRILSDHPGPSFTRNFDKAFVTTIKELLRSCKDPSTLQLLRETLDNIEATKQLQDGTDGLLTMWRREKGAQASLGRAPQDPNAHGNRGWQGPGQSQAYGAGYGQPRTGGQSNSAWHGSSSRALPPASELASRVEEARNTAKILLQLIQSTPNDEVLSNDLVREFSDRCQAAQRSMQGYINCNDPFPDDATMLTLIETNEQLSLAASRYQRCLLTARRAMGGNASPRPEDPTLGSGAIATPPETEQNQSVFAPSSPGLSNSADTHVISSPPPNMLKRLSSREQQSPPRTTLNSQSSRLPPPDTSNPFSDELGYNEKPATNNALGIRNGSVLPPQPQQTTRSSRAISVDSEPSHAPSSISRSDDYDNPYASTPTAATAAESRHSRGNSYGYPSPVPFPQQQQPQQQQYQGYHITAAEIDGHPEVGRSDGSHGPGFARAVAEIRSGNASISPLDSGQGDYSGGGTDGVVEARGYGY